MSDYEYGTSGAEWHVSAEGERTTLKRDNESFASKENSQPEDEAVTREGAVTETQQPDREDIAAEKENKKRRKEFLKKGLAMVTGAVAVVMVATSLSDSKGTRDDSICPVCGATDCPYFMSNFQNELPTEPVLLPESEN